MKATIVFLLGLTALATAITVDQQFLPLQAREYSAFNDILSQVSEASHLGKALKGYIHLKMKLNQKPNFSKLFQAFDQIIAFLKTTKINEDDAMALRKIANGKLITAYTNTVDTEQINKDNASEAITDYSDSIADGKTATTVLEGVLSKNQQTQKDVYALRIE